MRIVRRRTDQENGVGIDETADFRNGDAIGRAGAGDGLQLDFEVGGRFVECGVSGRGNDPTRPSAVRSRPCPGWLHFRLCHASLRVGFLSGGKTGHQDRLCASTRRRTSTVRRCIEHCQYLVLPSVSRLRPRSWGPSYHSNDLRLHLSDARKDVGVYGIGHPKHLHRRCLQVQ